MSISNHYAVWILWLLLIVNNAMNIETFIRDYFRDNTNSQGAANVPNTPDNWGTTAPKDIPIPLQSGHAYIIPITYSQKTANVKFYAQGTGVISDTAQRVWVIKIDPKPNTNPPHGTSEAEVLITELEVTESKTKFSLKKGIYSKDVTTIKADHAHVVYIAKGNHIDITPSPTKTVHYLGCFFFFLFNKFDVPSASAQDNAKVDVNGGGKMLLQHIRVFEGKESSYVDGTSLYIPTAPGPAVNGEPWRSETMLQLINHIKDKTMTDLQQCYAANDHQLIQNLWTDIVNAASAAGIDNFNAPNDNLGTVMTKLWSGDSPPPTPRVVTNQAHFMTIFNRLWQCPDIEQRLREIVERNEALTMNKPQLGWRFGTKCVFVKSSDFAHKELNNYFIDHDSDNDHDYYEMEVNNMKHNYGDVDSAYYGVYDGYDEYGVNNAYINNNWMLLCILSIIFVLCIGLCFCFVQIIFYLSGYFAIHYAHKNQMIPSLN